MRGGALNVSIEGDKEEMKIADSTQYTMGNNGLMLFLMAASQRPDCPRQRRGRAEGRPPERRVPDAAAPLPLGPGVHDN